MGASSSIVVRLHSIKNNNYISYAEKDRCGEIIYNEIIRMDYNMIQGQGVLETEGYLVDDDHLVFTDLVTNIMANSNCILICISKHTVSSFHQAIEIHAAMESHKNIVFIFTEEDFTPYTTPYLRGLVKRTRWLPGYDELTIDATLKNLEATMDLATVAKVTPRMKVTTPRSITPPTADATTIKTLTTWA